MEVETFWANSSGGFEGSGTFFFTKESSFLSSLTLFIFSFIFPFIFSLLFHLVSSFLFHLLSVFFILSLILPCFFSSLVLLLLSSSLSLLFSCLSSSLLLSCLSSFTFSCLVSSLLFHLLLPSCLVSSSLVSLPLSLFLCLCLRVMLCVVVFGGVCVVVCVVVCVCCGVCVCVCVCCGTLKKRAKNSVWIQKTAPCVHSIRPRVYRHHAHMCYHMRAWCRYTRGRFESTHMRAGGHRQFCLPEFAHVWLSRASEVHQKKPLDLKNESNRARSRFLSSFALPDKTVKFQLSGRRRWPRWFD